MSTPDDKRLDPFIDWLDALVTGTSTPDIDALADPELSDICAAASQFHGLDQRLGQYAGSVSSRSPSWEEVMSAHSPALATPGQGPTGQVDSRSPLIPLANPRFWERVASALLVASIVLAVSAGLWRASSEFGFGNSSGPPPEQPTIPFGGAVAQDEDGNLDPADLPTAEDCTVEPLTVDDVLWYVEDPMGAEMARDLDHVGTPIVYPEPATPADTPVGGPASAADMAELAAFQRLWMACVLADSPFQVWALETPDYVRKQIVAMVPVFASKEDARAVLESLETGDMSELVESGLAYGPPYLGTTCSPMALISTDPVHSLKVGEGAGMRIILVGFASYDLDGTLLRPYIDPTIEDARGAGVYRYEWNEARSTWLIGGMPNCG